MTSPTPPSAFVRSMQWLYKTLLPFFRIYRRIANTCTKVLTIAKRMPFGLGAAIVLSVAFFVPQTLEALRVLAENGTGEGWALALTGVGLLFAAMSIWYSSRVILYQMDPDSIAEEGCRGWAARNLPRLAGALPIAAFGLASYVARSGTTAARGWLTGFAVAGVLGGVLFFLATALRSRLVNAQRQTWIRDVRRLPIDADAHDHPQIGFRDLPRAAQIYIGCSNLAWLSLFVLATFSAGTFARALGPVAILLLGAATWVPLGSGIFYFGRLARFPALSALLIAAIIFSVCDWNDNHTLRFLDSPRAGNPPELGAAFEQWLKTRADRDQFAPGTYPVFLVAAEGGGLRTAYNAALILSAIQDRCPAFAQHVFAISGVSGGSVGATVFAALCAEYAENRADHPHNVPLTRPGKFQLKADEVLREDFLSPLLASGLYPDLVQRFLPRSIDAFDRARALERSFERAFHHATKSDRLAQSFYDLGAKNPATPGLVLNTTLVETGQRMIISNYHPRDERLGKLLSLSELDGTKDVAASTAATASARFTYVTPVAAFPRKDARGKPNGKVRIADGGYFENSGSATLKELIAALRIDQRAQRERRFKLVVIVLSSPSNLYSAEGKIDYPHGLGEAVSPIRALLNTRSARGASALADLGVAITTLSENHFAASSIRFELVQGDVALPLGWLLSNGARKAMMDQLGSPRFGDAPESVNARNEYSFGQVIQALTKTTP